MTAVDTYLNLNRLAKARCECWCPDYRLTLAVLLMANRPEGATQKEISRATGANDYTVTKLKRPLLKKKLVTDKTDDCNPKLKRIRLTAKGRKFLAPWSSRLGILRQSPQYDFQIPHIS